TTPDVGGGFGMKAFMYPEYFAVACAARLLCRPVRWMGTRSEAMLNDNAGRDLVTEASLALAADGRITALRVDTVCNIGAYNSLFAQNIQTVLAQKVITGCYDIPRTAMAVRGVFTNTAPVDAYRGAGRPEGIYIIERLIDAASRTLDLDPFEFRKRNFIRPEQLPYQNFADETIDVGNFARVLDRSVAEADVAGFSTRRKEAEARKRLRGLGLCYYIETILGDPDETTEIVFANDGRVDMMVGTQSNGQGHETAYAQILHERSGIPFDRIRVVQGDSDKIPAGGGTGGSRSVTTQGTSINATADTIIEAMTPFAAECLEGGTAIFEDGAYHVPGMNRFMTLLEVGQEAIRQGRRDLVSTRVTSTIRDKSFPNGAHLCEVEIDPETGHCDVVRYTVVDDLGVLINPMLVRGQIHGGVVQGIGQALHEHVVFDESGQLLTASFMDYAIPRASGLPFIEFHSEPTPSLNNPIGMKGCGEAGTIGALAAVTNAVLDALWDEGVRNIQMPLTPNRIWEYLQKTQSHPVA
ncbi:MAG: molybdopterin-dependent oxidoreductase, partial [Rhodobacteraceae bacterium]|nr:molybdopterin-dependent oxidoreductase [Paracoccaceae bacterium]